MFYIQLGHIKINTFPVQEFDTVRELLFNLFHSDEESYYLFWNDIPIAFSYKEGASKNFDNILAMIWLIQKEAQGETKASLLSDTLNIDLQLFWEGDTISVTSFFTTEIVHLKTYATTLQQKNTIDIPKDVFLNEWNTLLKQLIVSIEASNCTIADTTERRKLELLSQTETAIKSYGKLYINV